jgi:host factor-I protein
VIAARGPTVQDRVLNALRRSKAPVGVFLMKGIRLQGVIAGFDNFSVQLRRGGTSQLVYKHAISTIVPSEWPAEVALDQLGGGAGDLQDAFLTEAQAGGTPMALFLMSGVQLEGRVAGFDQYVVVLDRHGQAQMIYKHAISTLQPGAVTGATGAERVAEDVA